jgi:hypothetical protein
MTCKTCSEKKIPIGTTGAITRRTRNVFRMGDGRARYRARKLARNDEAEDCGVDVVAAEDEEDDKEGLD